MTCGIVLYGTAFATSAADSAGSTAASPDSAAFFGDLLLLVLPLGEDEEEEEPFPFFLGEAEAPCFGDAATAAAISASDAIRFLIGAGPQIFSAIEVGFAARRSRSSLKRLGDGAAASVGDVYTMGERTAAGAPAGASEVDAPAPAAAAAG